VESLRLNSMEIQPELGVNQRCLSSMSKVADDRIFGNHKSKFDTWIVGDLHLVLAASRIVGGISSLDFARDKW
jgi:hypothetical protein